MADYLGTSLFVAFDGDHIGREVGRASLADDVSGLRKLSQAIDQGNHLWGSWALACGGTIVSLGGDEGRLEVPAEKLGDVSQLRAQYEQAVGAPCSVGVGLTLSEADKALLYAKMHGGNRVCFYTPDMEEELDEAQKRMQNRGEISKIADEYLGKAEAPGKAQPQHPNQSASGSQGQQAAATIQGGAAQQMDAPAAPPLPGESEMEKLLHQHAQKQKGQDGATLAVQQQQNGREAMRQQVVKVLKQVKQAAPLLEEAKSQMPDAYKAVMSAIQAMVLMAKELVGPGASGSGGMGDSPAQEKSGGGSDTKKSERLEKMACIHDNPKKPMTVYRVQDANGKGPYEGLKREAQKQPGYHEGAGYDSKLHDALTENFDVQADPSFNPDQDFGQDLRALKDVNARKGLYGFEKPEHAEEWFGREGMRKLRMLGYDVAPVKASRVHRSTTGKQVLFQPMGKGEKLPMPDGGATHHELNLPVGATRDGRVKVRHADGTASWVEVRSGIVMSQDGHAISARNPGGK